MKPYETGRGPTVIVVHEVFGLVDHIRDVADRFAAEGFHAVAPALYEGVRANAGVPEILQFLSTIPDRRCLDDLGALVKPGAAVVGFCWGGRMARMLASERPELACAVEFYGRITPETPRCPYLGFFGEEDAGIPVADIEKLRARLGPDARLFIYPDAGHGFFNDTRPAYDPVAAADAWAKTIEFLKQRCC